MGTDTPRRFEDVTPAWLTARLRESGVLEAGAVTGITVEPIGVGVGFLGQLARLRLSYAGPDAGPATMIGKLPTLEPGGRGICQLFQFYEREINFYRELAGRLPLRVPGCYASVMDVAADDYLILLEDFGGLRMGDDAAGCTVADAEAAIRSLGALHGAWWDSPRLADLDWMPLSNAPVHQMIQPAYQQSLPAFLSAVGEEISPGLRTISERMATRIGEMLDHFTRPPMTVAHGDFRLDNLFFGAGGATGAAAIDWQIAFRGRGIFDVAYFLSGCLAPATRRAEEMRLLRLWWELATGGRGGYTFEEALLDYRGAVLYCHVYTVIATGALDPANERGMAVFRGWLTRRSAAIEDLDSAALVP